MQFKELEKKKINEVEKDILNYWKDINILEKSIDTRNDKKFVFYDGPATANGMPGVHHMVAKELKDTFCKYKTMQGFKVRRKVGWDTHGLPVEVQVEKELGFSGKKDIEKYGIEAFNKKCREAVWANEKAFKDLTEQMGQFIDLDNPYITYDNKYIETEWWILKKFHDENLIYNGLKILPYCPRCGTGLASHEVAQGYKEISVNTVIVPFKKKDEDAYFLVWTTTPWTLLSNVALCVNPEEEYVKVKSSGYKFILASKLASTVLGSEYKVIEKYKGKDLEMVEYEQLLPFLKVNKKGFYVTCADYVTMEDGTGIVHIAPAFGEDDYQVGLKYNLPILNPVGEDGKYTEGPWKDRFVMDPELEIDIIKYLKENDKLFKKIKMTHNYPHCWRCKTPLLYYSKPSYYIKVTDFKDKIIEANKTVNWVPDYVGEKRFGNWLEELKDWAISRNRYWGTPLPLWVCDCTHEEMIGSISELVEKSIEKIDTNIDLHRPYVDSIHIKCPKCGNTMSRVKDVIDCWFDSGSMPFAQYHYPFENKELFESQFPADFISEGIDQTRGWFYSLLVISTFVMGKSPYKNVLVNDLLLDKNGQKMHKSRGNAISPFGLIENYGADTIRWYLPSVSPVWTPIKFDEDGVKDMYSKYISTFKNTYSFFQMYANADNIDPREYNIEVENRPLIDKWIISKLNKLIKDVTDSYEKYDLTPITRKITEFLNDDLSNWYIRSNRRRFWDSELTVSKKAVYLTTYEVLLTLTKLVAPISPFIAEEIYRNLTGNESVHLETFPKYDCNLINESVEKQMDLVRDICSLGRFAREEVKIKVRQPISEVLLDINIKDTIGNLTSIIEEELNVKKINFISDLTSYMDYTVKPNYRQVGKIFGSKINDFKSYLETLNNEDINLINTTGLNTTFDGKDLLITKDMVDVKINAKEGFTAQTLNNTFVILNTNLTEDLIYEGIAREFVRKVQSIRKELDLVITSHINIYYNSNDIISKSVANYEEYIKGETLANNIIKDDTLSLDISFNEENIGIKIEKL